MNTGTRLSVLGAVTLAAIIVTFTHAAIPQDPVFHQFADQRTILGIPHFADVVTNLPFLIIGLYGLFQLKRTVDAGGAKRIYAMMFTGILLTALGSAYYHYNPNNDTLVYDRIPMTLVFMSLLAATIYEFIDQKTGASLLYPLLLLGVGSVCWWHYTEVHVRGDLRLYLLIQFYPMIAIPLIIWLFPSASQKRASLQLVWVVVWYVVAKVFEHFDKEVYFFFRFVSGHSLKHLAAAVATWYLVSLYKRKHG